MPLVCCMGYLLWWCSDSRIYIKTFTITIKECMKDNYRGLLTQEERWKVWQESLGKPMGSYSVMRDKAEEEKFKRTYGY